MTPTFPASTDAFRDQIRTFLAEHLPEGWQGLGSLPSGEVAAFVEQWRKTLHEAGLLAPSWPKEFGGGGLTPLESVILNEEFARAVP